MIMEIVPSLSLNPVPILLKASLIFRKYIRHKKNKNLLNPAQFVNNRYRLIFQNFSYDLSFFNHDSEVTTW